MWRNMTNMSYARLLHFVTLREMICLNLSATCIYPDGGWSGDTLVFEMENHDNFKSASNKIKWLFKKMKAKSKKRRDKERKMNTSSLWGVWKRIEEERRQKPTHYGCVSSESSLSSTQTNRPKTMQVPFWTSRIARRMRVYRRVCSICGRRSFPTTVKHTSHYTICAGKAKKYIHYTGANSALSRQIWIFMLGTFICKICDSILNKITVFKNHIKAVHYGEKPFECTTCGKSSSWKENLKEHMFVRTGEVNWTCPLCDKSMSNASSKYNHRRSCTGIASSSVSWTLAMNLESCVKW